MLFHCLYFFIYFLSPYITNTERLNPDTGRLQMSYSKFKRKDLSKLGDLILTVKLSLSLSLLCLLIYFKM